MQDRSLCNEAKIIFSWLFNKDSFWFKCIVKSLENSWKKLKILLKKVETHHQFGLDCEKFCIKIIKDKKSQRGTKKG